jgi:hypothetical protein
LLIQAKQADHPTHAETESWPNLTKRTEPAKAAPVLLCLYCLSPRSLVRSFACSLVRFCLVPDAYSSPAHQKNQLALVS